VIVLKVDIVVKPGAEAKCVELIRILQEHSRKEPGCVQYVGHQSIEDPLRFMFYEVYKDHAAVHAHRNAPYYKEYVEGGLGEIVESRGRELYTPVE